MQSFDIHIDALTLSESFETHLTKKLGFERSDFSGHPEGLQAYIPPHHLTRKMETSTEFRAIFDRVREYVTSHTAMTGYVEGELIVFDEELESRTFDPSVKPPFTLATTFLPPGTFREDEVHVTLSRDESDPRLIQSLIAMGLIAAYIPKTWGIEEVFTTQGSRKDIEAIIPPLKNYLTKAGGGMRCSIKEERVADWWLSEPNVGVPPVIETIKWAS